MRRSFLPWALLPVTALPGSTTLALGKLGAPTTRIGLEVPGSPGVQAAEQGNLRAWTGPAAFSAAELMCAAALARLRRRV
ncbi:protein of unknown function [Methylorubrum extorquens]|uniref:Uncharacterized protein n=1 Tax=Methylorubrum extorquens TaxID=408 RepID=A0A2N9AHG0_METEX|nr:protein of unknown function [Methylorubrum extorquens]